jgi:preprotein translocase subunit SecD
VAKRPSRGTRGSTSTRPVWTRLGVLAAVFIALYATMFITGHNTPKLGLDLQGGTSVTLKPKLVDTNGKPLANTKVSSGAINQAVDIIRQRVNGLGVAEAEVVRAGSNIEISVPGKGRNEVVDLVGQTAQLEFRIPFDEAAAQLVTTTPTPSVTPTPSATTAPKSSATPSAKTSGSAPATKPSASPASPSAAASSASSLGAQAASPAVPVPSANATATLPVPSSNATATLPPTATSTPCVSAPGTAATPPACITAQFAIQVCGKYDIHGANVSTALPKDWLVACDRAATTPTKFILRPASLSGTAVSSASATIQTGVNGTSTGQWIVNVNFTGKGQTQWANLTQQISSTSGCPASSAPQCQLAVVLDGVVQSAPVIQGRIPGSAEITGTFTQSTANDLANVLKYGALPIAFDKSEAVSVSATLGKASLNAGLLAGAIGLALVVIYSFFYYRALGIVTISSLLVSGIVTFGCIVVLGQVINFTLTLAGIAGFIVAVGITADSFVVFYERLKDEVHEGRTVRTSVERSWVRARRTILSADTVSFLAAAALYWLSIGSVRGFAFTLGLSTLLDLLVVFLFTKPVVTLLVRHPLFSTSRFSGLSSRALGTSVATTAPVPARARLAKRTTVGGVAAPAPPPGPAPTPSDAPSVSDQEGS